MIPQRPKERGPQGTNKRWYGWIHGFFVHRRPGNPYRVYVPFLFRRSSFVPCVRFSGPSKRLAHIDLAFPLWALNLRHSWIKWGLCQLYSASKFAVIPWFLALDSIHFNVLTPSGISLNYCWFTFVVAVVIKLAHIGVWSLFVSSISLPCWIWLKFIRSDWKNTPAKLIRSNLEKDPRWVSFPCLLNPLPKPLSLLTDSPLGYISLDRLMFLIRLLFHRT